MKISLDEFAAFLWGDGKSLTTISGYENVVREWLGWLVDQSIDKKTASTNDLLSYVEYLKKDRKNKPRTINGKLLAIRWYYRYLQSKDNDIVNIALDMQVKGVIRKMPHDQLEWEELEQLYAAYPLAGITGKRNKVITGLLVYQGLTNGEIRSIKLEDIDLEKASIYIGSRRKSNSRILKLEASQLIPLQNYILQVRPLILGVKERESENLILSTGKGIRIDNVMTRVTSQLRKLNPNVINIKQIRASVITYWLKKHNTRQVQYMVGHRYASSTEHYRTDHLEDLQDKLNSFHPLG